MGPARRASPQCAGRLRAAISEPLLQSAQGEFYCNDGLVKDCRAVKERASSGATTTIRIECGPGRVCRRLQQRRTTENKNAPSLKRQGKGRHPPGAKSSMGKSPGREKIVVSAGKEKVAPASCRLSRGRPALGVGGQDALGTTANPAPSKVEGMRAQLSQLEHGASTLRIPARLGGAPPDHQCR